MPHHTVGTQHTTTGFGVIESVDLGLPNRNGRQAKPVFRIEIIIEEGGEVMPFSFPDVFLLAGPCGKLERTVNIRDAPNPRSM